MTPLRRRLVLPVLLGYQRSKTIQRAHDRADHVGGDLRVERGRIKLGMSEQNLDQTHIGFLLEQVGGKAMPQVCGVTRFLISAMAAAALTARLNCRVVIGSTGS